MAIRELTTSRHCPENGTTREWSHGRSETLSEREKAAEWTKQSMIEALREVRFLHDIDNEHLLENRRRDADAQRGSRGRCCSARARCRRTCSWWCREAWRSTSTRCGGGSRRIMAVGPGEILGWSALLEQTQMTATATTIVLSQGGPDQHRPVAHDLQAQSAVRLRAAAAHVARARGAAERDAAATARHVRLADAAGSIRRESDHRANRSCNEQLQNDKLQMSNCICNLQSSSPCPLCPLW